MAWTKNLNLCTGFKGVGLHFRRQKNLIVRNIKSSFVNADNGDGLKIEV